MTAQEIAQKLMAGVALFEKYGPEIAGQFLSMAQAINEQQAQLTAALERERVLKGKVGELRAALSGVQWVLVGDSPRPICPECERMKLQGHHDWCEVGQALAETEGK